jgi:hypothetical protein
MISKEALNPVKEEEMSEGSHACASRDPDRVFIENASPLSHAKSPKQLQFTFAERWIWLYVHLIGYYMANMDKHN